MLTQTLTQRKYRHSLKRRGVITNIDTTISIVLVRNAVVNAVERAGRAYVSAGVLTVGRAGSVCTNIRVLTVSRAGSV